MRCLTFRIKACGGSSAIPITYGITSGGTIADRAIGMMTDSGMRMNTQTKLSAEQIAEFYHVEFVEDQVRDFRALIDGDRADKVIVDIGGDRKSTRLNSSH